MSNLELLKETAIQIKKDLFPDDQHIEHFHDLEALKNFLKILILNLLKNDLNLLLNHLYKIDIEEKKLKQAFRLLSETDIAEEIATLVIKRESEKVIYRTKYSAK